MTSVALTDASIPWSDETRWLHCLKCCWSLSLPRHTSQIRLLRLTFPRYRLKYHDR